MEENKQYLQHIMLYYFKKGRNATEMQKKKDLCSVQRRCCDLSNVSKWFAKFCAGDFSMDNAPPLGRPAIAIKVDTD